MISKGLRATSAIVLCIAASTPLAAGCPERPVRLIVPSPPGGGTDVSARMFTPKLGEVLVQKIVVDNRGGASGNIGAEAVARS
jgi:tripartite-type tricarboxylate transporter receptor subunit TctC